MLGATVFGMVRPEDRSCEQGWPRGWSSGNAMTSCSVIQAWLCYFVAIPVATGEELRPLFRAIRVVETSSMETRDVAIGDDGRSIGPYQISRAYWVDSGKRGRWTGCRGQSYSERVMLAYWKRHCPTALGQRNLEVLARIHNGGPNGQSKCATSSYWQRVRHAMHPRAPSP